jgi:hypothetical protein
VPAEVLLDFTQDVRGYAAKLNEKQEGMEEMAKKFRGGGDRIYVPVPGPQLL